MDRLQAAIEGDLEWFKTNSYDIDKMEQVPERVGATVLMLASKENHKELCLYLLSQGADVNARDNFGNTALIYSSGHVDDDADVCSMLCIDSRSIGGHLLEERVPCQPNKDIGSRWEQVPISKGADVNIQNYQKTTALMNSAYNGNINVCMVLLSAGADIKLLDNLNRNALMFAALSGHVNVCSLLISRGANVNFQNSNGYTAHMFAHAGKNMDVVTLLDTFPKSPRTLRYCLLKTNPKTSIKALLRWNDYHKEIKRYL